MGITSIVAVTAAAPPPIGSRPLLNGRGRRGRGCRSLRPPPRGPAAARDPPSRSPTRRGRARRGHRGGPIAPSLRVSSHAGRGHAPAPPPARRDPRAGAPPRAARQAGRGFEGHGALPKEAPPRTRCCSAASGEIRLFRPQNNPAREQLRQTRLGRAPSGFPGIFIPLHGELGGKTVSVSRKRLEGSGLVEEAALGKVAVGGF